MYMPDAILGILYFGPPVAIFFGCLLCFPPSDEGADEALRAPVVLPHFPYAAPSPEPPPVCAICLDELRQGQLCSEVPACRHVFHEDCIRVWANKNNSCPMCGAMIVLGETAADDMV